MKESVTSLTAIGGRESNEDRSVCELIRVRSRTYRLLGVFDGHGGSRTAEVAAEITPGVFEKLLTAQRPNMISVMRSLFTALHERTKGFGPGSTASLVCIPSPFKKAYVAVLGDSPVVICSPTDVFVGPEHNVRSNMTERGNALNRGARYWEPRPEYSYIGLGERFLQVSRCLGDRDLESILDRTPEIAEVPLTPASTVLVASDGLMPPAEPQETWLGRMIELARHGASAEEFVQDGISNYGKDNVTVIVWRRE